MFYHYNQCIYDVCNAECYWNGFTLAINED